MYEVQNVTIECSLKIITVHRHYVQHVACPLSVLSLRTVAQWLSSGAVLVGADGQGARDPECEERLREVVADR